MSRFWGIVAILIVVVPVAVLFAQQAAVDRYVSEKDAKYVSEKDARATVPAAEVREKDGAEPHSPRDRRRARDRRAANVDSSGATVTAADATMYQLREAGNLIRNGGFEVPDVEQPWRHINPEDSGGEFVWKVEKGASGNGYVEIKDTIWSGNSEWNAPDSRGRPDQSVDIDYEGILSQEFATTAGEEYVLRFAYAHNPDLGNRESSATVRVVDVINGEKLSEQRLTHDVPASYAKMNYTSFFTTFVAKGSTTRLEFESHQKHTRGFVVDAVSVVTKATLQAERSATGDDAPAVRKPDAEIAEVKEIAPPADATAGGKYSHLLRTIHAPEDAANISSFHDLGYYDSPKNYKGEVNLVPGYWVYAQPYWYIWKNRNYESQAAAPVAHAESTVPTPVGRPVIVKLVGGGEIKGRLAEESATTLTVVPFEAPHGFLRVERSQVISLFWSSADGLGIPGPIIGAPINPGPTGGSNYPPPGVPVY